MACNTTILAMICRTTPVHQTKGTEMPKGNSAAASNKQLAKPPMLKLCAGSELKAKKSAQIEYKS